MSDSIKKGILYTALGFLFTLVNINLNFGSLTVNVMPDFIGWILILMALGKLGDYVESKSYLKYLAIGLIVINAVTWGLSIVMPDTNIWWLNTVIELISTIFIFIYFDSLRQVAEDAGSIYTDQLTFLRWVHVAVYLASAIITVFAGRLTPEDINAANAALILGFGVVAIVVAIWTLIILFKLNKEIKNL